MCLSWMSQLECYYLHCTIAPYEYCGYVYTCIIIASIEAMWLCTYASIEEVSVPQLPQLSPAHCRKDVGPYIRPHQLHCYSDQEFV